MTLQLAPKAQLQLRAPFEAFRAQFADCRTRLTNSRLDRLRAKAWEKFTKCAPRTKAAPYRSLRLDRIAESAELRALQTAQSPLDSSWCQQQISRWRLPECEASCLVFVDGRWSPELSSLQSCLEALEVLDLPSAMEPFSQHLLRRSVTDEEEFFALASAALSDRGCVVYLQPGAHMAAPLQILHVTSSSALNADGAHFSRLHLIASPDSQVHLVQTGPAASAWRHHLLECTLEANARVDLDELIPLQETRGYFRATRALLHRGARFHTASFTPGGLELWQDLSAQLSGPESQVQLSFSNALSGRAHSTISAQVQHSAPNASSHQLVRSALDGSARAHFRGAILVDRGAGNTRSYQLNNNLLLSDRAIAETQPNLEIFHDEVKASHGATMGRLSDEELFYLQSRGLEAGAARRLLIRGFLELGICRLRSETLQVAARRAAAPML